MKTNWYFSMAFALLLVGSAVGCRGGMQPMGIWVPNWIPFGPSVESISRSTTESEQKEEPSMPELDAKAPLSDVEPADEETTSRIKQKQSRDSRTSILDRFRPSS